MSKLTTLSKVRDGQLFEIEGVPFLALDGDLNHGNHIRLVDHLVVRPSPHHTIRIIDADEVKRLLDKRLGNHLLIPSLTSVMRWSYEYAKRHETNRKRRRKS